MRNSTTPPRLHLTDEPTTINRNAVIVRPTQPFLDWLPKLDVGLSHMTLDTLQLEPTIYLIPETDLEGDVDYILRRCCDDIFVEHLECWYNDPSVWPAPRTFETFQSWFECLYHSMVIDLAADPLLHDWV